MTENEKVRFIKSRSLPESFYKRLKVIAVRDDCTQEEVLNKLVEVGLPILETGAISCERKGKVSS